MADANVVVKLSALSNNKGLDDFGKGLKKVDGLAKKLGKVLGGLLAVATVKKILDVGDAWQKQANDIAATTGSMDSATRYMKELRDMAKGTATSADELTDAFIALRQTDLKPTVSDMEDLAGLAAFKGVKIGDVTKAMERGVMGRNRRLRELFTSTDLEIDGDKIFGTIDGVMVETNKGMVDFMRQVKKIQGADWAAAQDREINTLAGAMTKLKDSGQEALIKISEGFGGDLHESVHKVVNLIESMMPLFELAGKVLGSLLDVGEKVFGGFADLIGDNELAFGNIEDIIAAIIVGLGVLKVAALVGLAPISLAGLAVVALGAALFALFKWFTSDHGKSFIEKAMDKAGKAVDWVKGKFADFGKWILGLFDSVMGHVDAIFGNYFRAILALLKGDFSGAAEHMKNMFLGVFDFLLGYLQTLLGGLDKALGWVGIDTGMGDMVDGLRDHTRPSGVIDGMPLANRAVTPSTSGKASSSVSNVSSNVGRVEVKIDGSTNMGPNEVGRSVSKGVDDALGRQTRKLQHNYAGT